MIVNNPAYGSQISFHVIHQGNVYQLKKDSKSHPNKPKKISLLEASLYQKDDQLHFSLKFLTSSDTLKGFENLYETVCLEDENTSATKNATSASDNVQSYSLSEYRSCDLTHDVFTKENPSTTFSMIQLTCRIFSRAKNLRVYILDAHDAKQWHSQLSQAIKVNGKWSLFQQKVTCSQSTVSLGALSITHGAAAAAHTAVSASGTAIGGGAYRGGRVPATSPTVKGETSAFNMFYNDLYESTVVEEEAFEMIDNDVYESTCPKDSFRAAVEVTDKSKSLGLTGDYFLRVAQGNMDLLQTSDYQLTLTWAIKDIRKFGLSGEKIQFEAGSGCQCGAGTFIFTVIHAKDFFQKLQDAKKAIQVEKANSQQQASLNGKSVMATSNSPTPPPTSYPGTNLSAGISEQRTTTDATESPPQRSVNPLSKFCSLPIESSAYAIADVNTDNVYSLADGGNRASGTTATTSPTSHIYAQYQKANNKKPNDSHQRPIAPHLPPTTNVFHRRHAETVLGVPPLPLSKNSLPSQGLAPMSPIGHPVSHTSMIFPCVLPIAVTNNNSSVIRDFRATLSHSKNVSRNDK